MSKTTSFGFSNQTISTAKQFTLYDLGVLGNYALRRDEPTEVVLVNNTTAVDKEEILAFRCKDMSHINSSLNIQYPSPVAAGIQYQVGLEVTATTEDPATGFRVDEPIVAQLTIRHPKSGNITAEQVNTVVSRLISAALKTDGTWRFNELMRSALKPTED